MKRIITTFVLCMMLASPASASAGESSESEEYELIYSCLVDMTFDCLGKLNDLGPERVYDVLVDVLGLEAETDDLIVIRAVKFIIYHRKVDLLNKTLRSLTGAYNIVAAGGIESDEYLFRLLIRAGANDMEGALRVLYLSFTDADHAFKQAKHLLDLYAEELFAKFENE